MYRLVITFLLIGSMASCVNAQVDSTSNHDWNVFVSPLSVLNPSYIKIQPGQMDCWGITTLFIQELNFTIFQFQQSDCV